MRISDGMGEITLVNTGSATAGIRKVYLWPEYNAGTVEPVPVITTRNGAPYAYRAVKPDERPIAREEFVSLRTAEYSSSGNITRRAGGVSSGLLFDARA